MVELLSDVIEWCWPFFIVGIISSILFLLTLFFGKSMPIVYGYLAINDSTLKQKKEPIQNFDYRQSVVDNLNDNSINASNGSNVKSSQILYIS